MDHKQPILHELLQQEQEPFHLQTFISDKRPHLNHSSPTAAAPEPCCGGGFLHVPPRTAAVLVEAAMRIHKQRRSKPKTQNQNAGLCLFGSLLKILKHRSANKAVSNRGVEERENPAEIRVPCSCSRRLCGDDMQGSFHDHSTADFEARLCSSPISPLTFSRHKSPTFSGRRTPELSSPATSPIRRVKQEKKNCVNGVEEEKEQCSPVSVLDTLYEDDVEHESLVGEEDDHDDDDDHDHDLERYANIERARQQLLERLERFEKLAALDQMDLEQKLLEASEEIEEGVEFEQLPLCRKQGLDMKRLIGEDECKVVMGRISCSVRPCLPRQAESGAIDMMVEFEEWERSSEVVEETVAEVEVAIFGGLIKECFCMDDQQLNYM